MLWLPLSLSADPVGEFLPQQVGVVLEYYEVEAAALPEMLRAYQSEIDGTPLRERVEAMAEKGEARLVDSAYLVSRSGQRAKIASVREWIYPIEWDPPEVPQKLSGPIDRDVNVVKPATPTAFETENVGNTFEVDAVIGRNPEIVDLNLQPKLVSLRGSSRIGRGDAKMIEPTFETMMTPNAITLKAGRSELVGVYSAPTGAVERAQKGVLAIATAKVLSAATKADYEAWLKSPRANVGEVIEEDPFIEGTNGARKPASVQVSLVAEFVEVDAALAGKIAHQISGAADATAIRRRLDGAIREGKAAVLATGQVLARSGIRAKVEAVRQRIYGVEFDPPNGPIELHGPIDPRAKISSSVSSTALESRNEGITVEVDNVVQSGGKFIDLNLKSESVAYIREIACGSGPSQSTHPLFETLRIETSATIADGTTMLVGMHSLETARAGEAATEEERKAVRGRRVLVFVSAKVKAVE
ncbi:MAG: hypothetical protein R3F11_14145 [Verrucomicrobiales bacterium]